MHAPTFTFIIWDSCTLKIQDPAAGRQTSSERDKFVQMPQKTDLTANQEPLISRIPLHFLYANVFLLMIASS